MIRFRLQQAGYGGGGLFTDEAVRAIHHYTRGYPRKLALVCHNALEQLVMKERAVVDEELVKDLIANDVKPVGVHIGEALDAFE